MDVGHIFDMPDWAESHGVKILLHRGQTLQYYGNIIIRLVISHATIAGCD